MSSTLSIKHFAGILQDNPSYSIATKERGKSLAKGFECHALSGRRRLPACAAAETGPGLAGGGAGPGRGVPSPGGKPADSTAAGGGDAAGGGGGAGRTGDPLRFGHQFFPVCRRRDPAGGLSPGAGRIPDWPVRHGGNEGREQHQFEELLRRRYPYCQGEAGHSRRPGPPALPGGGIRQHPDSLASRRWKDHPFAGSGPAAVRGCGGLWPPAGVPD